MLTEDRLACIVPTDGTRGGEAPALPVDDHAATLVQPVGDSDGSSPPFAINLVSGKIEHGGRSWLGSRERGLTRRLGRLDGSIGIPTW